MFRFIPTCMGNSLTEDSAQIKHPVHPHVHGELFFAGSSRDMIAGSSPRAWGTPYPADLRGALMRFIPTCMGNSAGCGPARTPAPVHPHVHGELLRGFEEHDLSSGSSPRAWGTLRAARSRTSRYGFIPTCMGNSGFSSTTGNTRAVHPHVHGELCCYAG